jgi:poly(hydroxyalkanoate) depolymerase family esterase
MTYNQDGKNTAMTRAMLASMREATRILRTSGPAEATAAIQRALQEAAPAASERETSRLSRPALAKGGSQPPFRASMPVGAPVPRAASAQREGPRVAARREKARKADVATGEFLTGSFANHAGARDYKLYVPSGYRGQELPLVVMLHGCTQTPDDFAAGTRMNAAAELKPCFVLYPAQAQRANGSRCWNWFKGSHQKRDRGEPSIIADMTRELLGKYEIDRRRIYVAGLSSGGAMAAVMKKTYPDLYAAVGVHSGLAYGAAHDLPSALEAMHGRRRATAAGAHHDLTPVIVFHGDGDTTVHPRNGDEVLAQCLPGHGASTDVQRGQAPDGHPFTRTLYQDDAGRVVAEHWLVHGGAHGWSGGSREGSYVDPSGPDATQEMLRFFSLWAQPA